ncbi:hypothetical protein [Desulfovibrio sp. X2]|uniref:hypothetical protein n=1 Tax=Desulfovibrio sp. X2 TaxID=941449 RepID=UPI00126890FB|nr:hypothetical protein [Desulfovibrio sp. X2]
MRALGGQVFDYAMEANARQIMRSVEDDAINFDSASMDRITGAGQPDGAQGYQYRQGRDAQGSGDDYRAWATERIGELASKYGDDVRPMVENKLRTRMAAHYNTIKGHEDEEVNRYKLNQDSAAFQNVQSVISTMPGADRAQAVVTAIEEYKDQFVRNNTPDDFRWNPGDPVPENLRPAWDTRLRKFWDTWLASTATARPEEAKKILAGINRAQMAIDSAENPEDKARLQNDLLSPGKFSPGTIVHVESVIRAEDERRKREQDQERRLYVASLRDREADVLASIQETGSEGPVDIAAEYRRFGAPDEASRFERTRSMAYKVRNFLHSTSTMPFEDRMAEAERQFTIVPGQTGAKQVLDLREGVERQIASDERERQAKIRAVKDQARQFQENPAGFVAPTVQARYQGHAGDDIQSATAYSLKLQTDLAKGNPLFRPRVLDSDQAKRLRSQYLEADADTKLSVLEGLNQYGRYKAQALGELGLTTAQLAQSALDQGDRADARLFVQADSMKDSDLPASMKQGGTTPQQFKNEVLTALGDSDSWNAATSLSRLQPWQAGATEQTAAMENTLVRFAMLKGDPQAAARFVDKLYPSFSEDGLASVILPKGTDTDSLRGKLRAARQSVVDGLESWQAGELGARKWRERRADILGSATWINSPDGDGLILIGPSGLAVSGKNGAPVRLTWDALGATQPDEGVSDWAAGLSGLEGMD